MTDRETDQHLPSAERRFDQSGPAAGLPDIPGIRFSDDPLDMICQLAEKRISKPLIAKYADKMFDLSGDHHKIRRIALSYIDLWNGGIQRVLSILSFLLTEGENGTKYEVILVTDKEPTKDDFPLPPSVKRVVLPKFIHFSQNYHERGKALSELILRYDIDAFISSSWDQDWLLWDLLCVKSSPKHPAFFIHTHNFCGYLWKKADNTAADTRCFYHLADGVITLSETDRLYWSGTNKNTRKIWNPCLSGPENLKNQWKDGPKHILWIARISDQKKPLDIVRIMEYVTRDLPDVTCHIVGKNNIELEACLREMIREHSLEGNIVLEGFSRDVDPFYRKADLFLSTSAYEGFPMTFMESASYGIPTVTYDIPWLEYYRIIDGWESVGQDDCEAAARAIVRLLTDREEWEDRSARIYESYRRYREHDFVKDWTRVFENFENGTDPGQPGDPTAAVLLDQLTIFHKEALDPVPDHSLYRDIEIAAIYESESWKVGNALIRPIHNLKEKFKKITGR